eukprot:6507982-Karenia_brevis.AAC.1
MEKVAIAPVEQIHRGIAKKSRTSMRHAFSKYKREHVVPKVLASLESPWWRKPSQTQHLNKHKSIGSGITAHELAKAGVQVRALQAWAQLRIQGCFVRDLSRQPPVCRLCHDGQESLVHLM